ncbi:type II toxin-antitoxin system RelE/ParE family toxin [Caballeronia sp. LjRoot34]|uniref:type II toxin-antitoxin system RelE/ParE family toxin n=1 Tax=Caballeronia sp. LjRoot34 TaxID=3342325 RepID=UPI003ECE80DD
MRIFKTKWFARWADTEGVTDAALLSAVEEMNRGLIDANLGGHVFKKRVGINGRGKRGGLRTLLAFRVGERAFFVFGFAKNERANVSDKGLAALKLLGSQLLGYDARTLTQALRTGELHEVESDE